MIAWVVRGPVLQELRELGIGLDQFGPELLGLLDAGGWSHVGHVLADALVHVALDLLGVNLRAPEDVVEGGAAQAVQIQRR